MSAPLQSAPGLMQHRPFVLFWLARVSTTMGYQMMALVIGWQLYQLTNSAFDLGLIGLIQFVPAVILTLLIGHTADRYDRRLIIRLAQAVYALSAALITTALFAHAITPGLLFGVVFLIGCARAFEVPTGSALVPALVPAPLVTRAVGGWTSANQVAIISGPALGGLLYAASPVAVAGLCALFFCTSITLVSLIVAQEPPAAREPPTFASVLAGFKYIGIKRRLLGVITLDLFVVLLGGVTALLPIFARDILAAGPIGLGLLRSAPATGALITAVLLSRFPVERYIGPKMFAVVAIYGVTTIVFGLSTWLPLSMMALALLGAADSLSIVIRFSLVQIETPDDKRGRVSAVNYLFVGSSNTLGDFESGTVAAWLGAVPSVLIGGLGSLLIAAIWMLIFPDLRRIDRFEPPEEKRT
ncbi:MAG: MFS transporter [Pseudolabrys sp.]